MAHTTSNNHKAIPPFSLFFFQNFQKSFTASKKNWFALHILAKKTSDKHIEYREIYKSNPIL